MEELSTQNNLNFVYGNNLVDKIKVSCHIEGSNMGSALKKLLSRYNISYKVFNNNSYILFKETNPIENTFRTVVMKQNVPSEDLNHLITEPKIISNSQPVYPADAVKYNIEGKVIVKLYVNKEGDIANIYVSRSSGFAVLDSATTNYAGKLKFSPALENGKPKNIWVSMTFDYRLINK